VSDCVVDRVLWPERHLPTCDECGGPAYFAEGRSRGDWQPRSLIVCGNNDQRCLQGSGKSRAEAQADWMRVRKEKRANKIQRIRDGERKLVVKEIDGWWDGDEFCRHDGFGSIDIFTPTYRVDGKPRKFNSWVCTERVRPVCWLIECARCARLWPNRWRRKDYWGPSEFEGLCAPCERQERAFDRRDQTLLRALDRTYGNQTMIRKMERELRHG
jgi:hypothetical protein